MNNCELDCTLETKPAFNRTEARQELFDYLAQCKSEHDKMPRPFLAMQKIKDYRDANIIDCIEASKLAREWRVFCISEMNAMERCGDLMLIVTGR